MTTKLHFTLDIAAPREKVWQVLWDDATYRQWTSAFMEGSHAVSDWKEGSKIQFLGPDGGGGMYSIIERSNAPEYMSFKHLGEIKDGKEQPNDGNLWSNAMENYTLTEHNGSTTLEVDLYGAPNEFISYFQEAFPKGLALVKSLSE